MGPIDAKRSYQWGRDQGCEQVRKQRGRGDTDHYFVPLGVPKF